MKEELLKILNKHYKMYENTPTLDLNKVAEDLQTLIEEERRKAVRGFVKYMQGEGFKDGVTRMDFAEAYLSQTKGGKEDDSYMYQVDGTMSPEDH
jgi:hypothetical protein